MKIDHLVLLSGGICSWASAMLVVKKHGLAGTKFLFADTIIEDDDLYRFLIETVSAFHGRPRKYYTLPIPPVEQLADRKNALQKLRTAIMFAFPHLTWIADGRTPWEVMRDHNCIAKPRMDMCSQELKRDLLDKWRKENTSPETCTVHFGMDWTECHRLEHIAEIIKPWRVASYAATERPIIAKPQMLEWLKREGIRPPRLYGLGFPHNNCGGFCIKAGQAHFAHLYRTLPATYLYHEAQEEDMRKRVGDYSVLRDRTGGTTKTLSLRSLRERIEAQGEFDSLDWGGCGCALPSLPPTQKAA